MSPVTIVSSRLAVRGAAGVYAAAWASGAAAGAAWATGAAAWATGAAAGAAGAAATGAAGAAATVALVFAATGVNVQAAPAGAPEHAARARARPVSARAGIAGRRRAGDMMRDSFGRAGRNGRLGIGGASADDGSRGLAAALPRAVVTGEQEVEDDAVVERSGAAHEQRGADAVRTRQPVHAGGWPERGVVAGRELRRDRDLDHAPRPPGG